MNGAASAWGDDSPSLSAEEAREVISAAVARFASGAPDPEAVAKEMERLPYQWQETLLDDLAAALLDGEPARTRAWTEATAAIAPQAFVASTVDHSVRFREAEHLPYYADRWRRASDPFEGLKARDGLWFEGALALFRLLQRLDPVAFCLALDRLPGPQWFGFVGTFTIGSVGAACSLVAAAPLVFRPDGSWTRSVAALVAVDAALRRIDRALGELRVPRSADDGEHCPWSADTARDGLSLAEAILARSDGPLLGLGFVAHAAGRHPPSYGRARQGTALERLSQQLRNALWPSLLSVEASGAWWRARTGDAGADGGRAARLHGRVESPLGAITVARGGFGLIVAAAGVLVRDEPGYEPGALAAKRAGCWALCVEALRTRDPEIPEAFEQDGGESWNPWWSALAELLATQAAPLDRFAEVQAAVAPQLERLAHRYVVDDVWIERPAAFSVMLALAAAVIGAARGRPWAAALHACAVDLAAALDALEQRHHPRELRRVLLAAIGTAPGCGAATAPGALRALLERVTDAPWDVLTAVSLLRRNGAPVDALRAALASLGVDVGTALRASEEAEALGVLAKDRLPVLRTVATDLGAAPVRAAVSGGERIVAESRCARLIAVGPLPRLAGEFGVDQPIGVLRTVGPVASADVRWAREVLREHADRIDAEVLVTPTIPGRRPLYGSVQCPADASEGAIDAAVCEALLSQDPYDRREVVVGAQRFGRAEVVRALGEALVQQGIVGLFGLRRTGKTTTARAVVEGIERSANVLWLDLQGIVRRDLAGVVAALRRAIGDRFNVPGLLEHDPQRDPGDELDEALQFLRRRNREETTPACLVFDEFDLLFEGVDGGKGVERAERLLGPLVSAAEARTLGLLAIGRDPRRFHGERGLEPAADPLVGRMRTVWLRGLDATESDEMLTRLGRRGGLEVGEAALREARSLAGGHPLLLRLVGRALREVAGHHGVRVCDDRLLGEVRERFIEDGEVQRLVADALRTLARRFPEAWRAVSPALFDGRGPALSALDPRITAPLRWLGLVGEGDVLPAVYLRLAPYVGVPREAA